jgi:uncharacterized protein (TIGR00369 family)
MTEAELDPGHVAWLKGLFAAQAFMRHLNVELEDFAPGRCALAIDHRPEFEQHTGVVHAGVVAALADNAAGGAAATLMPQGTAAVTVEYKINFAAPATGERLIARAEVIKSGRNISVARAEVYALSKGAERLCAVALVTLAPVTLGG